MITGAGQGIGEALARYFAERGDRVVVADRNPETGNRIAAEIREAGGEGTFVLVELADAKSVAGMIEQAEQVFGPVEVLINNARRTETQQFLIEEMSNEEWDSTLQTNLTGAFYCIRAVVPGMKRAGWGRIINMSSSTVLQPPGQRHYVHYITTKAGLVGMTRALSRELGPYGITVNALLPGSVDTGIERAGFSSAGRGANSAQSIPRREVPADLVGAAYFFASDESSFITGQSLPVDGGYAFS